MTKKIKIISLLSLLIIISVGVFFACKKEENKNITEPEILKTPVNNYTEQLAIEAHNIMVDFLLRSKEALDKNPALFTKICKEGNREELIALIGYNQADAIAKSERLSEIVKEVTEIFDIEGLPKNLNSCSSCALEYFPEILMDLNYDDQRAPQGWFDLFACLSACAFDCLPLVEFPALYAVCITGCTALCYYMSTARAVAFEDIER